MENEFKKQKKTHTQLLTHKLDVKFIHHLIETHKSREKITFERLIKPKKEEAKRSTLSPFHH